MFDFVKKYVEWIWVGIVVILCVALLVSIWTSSGKIHDLNTTNTNLVNQHAVDQNTMVGLKNTITSNEAAYQAALAIANNNAAIAAAEAKAAQDRAIRYRSLQDAIKNSPPSSDCSRSPVIRDTIDQLWPRPDAGRAGGVSGQDSGSQAGQQPANLSPPAKPS